MQMYDSKGKHLIFKHWKGISKGIYADELNSVKFNLDDQKIINCDDINKIDNNGNMIISYIVNEMIKLLSYNKNKFMKLSISYFLIDFINITFDLFNKEKDMDNLDIKRFNYLLSNETYINEVIERMSEKQVEGIYSEYHDEADPEITAEEKEDLVDVEEEKDALDIDADNEEDAEEQLYGDSTGGDD